MPWRDFDFRLEWRRYMDAVLSTIAPYLKVEDGRLEMPGDSSLVDIAVDGL